MTLSSGMALLSSYYYGRWRHGYVGWTRIIAVIHIYEVWFAIIFLSSSIDILLMHVMCAFVQTFWFTNYCLPLSLCARDGPSIVNLNGLDISQSNHARVALCSVWWTKHISVVVVVVMSGFDLCWTQLVTSLSATVQGFFERSKPSQNAKQSSHRCWNSTMHVSVVNPTHLVCMYLIKFVELATTMPWGVHLNKSRLDRKSDSHTFGIVMPVRRGGEV
jgi:hypothetical protein